jgi:sigma-B regulation protein RsbU (phosphoserine phosphatase)
MLSTLRSNQRKLLQEMGQAWLSTGIQTFTLEIEGKLIFQVPTEAPPFQGEATYLAEFKLAEGQQAQIRLFGPKAFNEHCQLHLQLEARLLSQTWNLETELEDMTGELVEHQDQLLALYDLTQSLRNQLDFDKALQMIAQEAADLVKCEAAFMLVQLPDGQFISEQVPHSLFSGGLLPQLFKRLESQTDRWLVNPDDLPPGVNNTLMLPMQLGDSTRAALGLVNRPGGFNSPDMKLARAIADQGTAQLENALLHQERLAQTRIQTEMELAREIQLRLLPQKLPHLPNADLFAASYPALEVGGDVYDFIESNDGSLTFVVADVSGKGMPSALLMSMTRTVLHNLARFFEDINPAALLYHANQELYQNLTEVGMLVTVFVGQYNPHTRSIRYANAGHSPVLFFGRGQVQMLIADAPPLGVLKESLCQDHELELLPGDYLMVATDGFPEAENQQGEQFGYQQMMQALAAFGPQSSQDIASYLLQLVGAFCLGAPQSDDQTLVILKGLP